MRKYFFFLLKEFWVGYRIYSHNKRGNYRAFSARPVVKNLPSSPGDLGSIPGQWTKIPHTLEQLSSRATATEPASCNWRGVCTPQCKSSCATTRTRCTQINKHFKKEWDLEKGPFKSEREGLHNLNDLHGSCLLLTWWLNDVNNCVSTGSMCSCYYNMITVLPYFTLWE